MRRADGTKRARELTYTTARRTNFIPIKCHNVAPTLFFFVDFIQKNNDVTIIYFSFILTPKWFEYTLRYLMQNLPRWCSVHLDRATWKCLQKHNKKNSFWLFFLFQTKMKRRYALHFLISLNILLTAQRVVVTKQNKWEVYTIYYNIIIYSINGGGGGFQKHVHHPHCFRSTQSTRMLSCLEQQVPILTGLDARPTCAAGCSEPSVNTLFKLVWLSQEFASFQVAVWKIERRGRRDKGRPAILLGASTCLVWGQKKSRRRTIA